MLNFKNLDDLNFKVIDITNQGTPDLTIHLNKITFSKKLIDDMGYPPFVCAMLDEENKYFALKSCKSQGDGSKTFPFSKSRTEQTSALSISAKAILQLLRTTMHSEWDSNHRYCMTGTYFSEQKTMVFDLNDAQELPLRKNQQ